MPRLITQSVVADFRGRLCEVAAELFTELGRDGFNMRELARRLRVSPMTAYRYFKDKEEILVALRARAFGRLADRLENLQEIPDSPLEKTAALVQAYMEFVQQEEANYRLMFDLFQSRSPAVPELLAEERRVRAAMTAQARLLTEDGEPELIGEFVWATLHGAATLHLTGKLPAMTMDRIVPETVRMLTCAFGGSWAAPAGDWSVLAAREPQARAPGYSGMAALPAAE